MYRGEGDTDFTSTNWRNSLRAQILVTRTEGAVGRDDGGVFINPFQPSTRESSNSHGVHLGANGAQKPLFLFNGMFPLQGAAAIQSHPAP